MAAAAKPGEVGKASNRGDGSEVAAATAAEVDEGNASLPTGVGGDCAPRTADISTIGIGGGAGEDAEDGCTPRCARAEGEDGRGRGGGCALLGVAVGATMVTDAGSVAL